MTPPPVAGSDAPLTPPPGPRGGLLGVMREFARDMPVFLSDTARRHGDVTRFRVGPLHLYMLSHPDDIETVLVKDHKRFKKDRTTQSLDELLGQGLVTSSGDVWRRQRALAAPLLQRKQIAGYADVMVARTREVVAGWSDGAVRDVHQDLMALTLDIVLQTLFDAEGMEGAHAGAGQAMETVMVEFQLMLDTWRRFAPRWLPHRARRRLRGAASELDRLVLNLIARTRERGATGDDLVSRLLAARYEDGSSISDQQLRDEAITMVVAGHETTAMALTWTLYLLSDHPEVYRRLEAEVDTVLGERAATFEDVSALTYTDAVVRESMRIYPPVWCIGRTPLEDMVFRGHRIPAGAEVLLPQWVVHRDPRWYDAPESFRPERWLDGLAKRLPRFAYFPFGGGPRVCIGNHFAQMEAALVLATVVQAVRLTRVAGHPVATFPSITLRARHGLKMTVARR